jgi:hypothetical protein
MAAAAAAVAQDTAGGLGGSSCGGGAAPVPVTPLHKGARRTLPSDGGGGDEVDKHLQALVERCLRIRNPGVLTDRVKAMKAKGFMGGRGV